MISLDEIKNIVGKHRELLANRYGIAVVSAFGLYVRGEQN
jgi:predicted nucleotidyltransferase